jgi:hypothetical protein
MLTPKGTCSLASPEIAVSDSQLDICSLSTRSTSLTDAEENLTENSANEGGITTAGQERIKRPLPVVTFKSESDYVQPICPTDCNAYFAGE